MAQPGFWRGFGNALVMLITLAMCRTLNAYISNHFLPTSQLITDSEEGYTVFAIACSFLLHCALADIRYSLACTDMLSRVKRAQLLFSSSPALTDAQELP